MTSITVKKNDKIIFIKLDDVSYFEADSNYTSIHSAMGVFLSTETIVSLENKLPDNFLRIHRGIILNKDYIKEAQKYFNSKYIITLNDAKNSNLTSGRSYAESIKINLGFF